MKTSDQQRIIEEILSTSKDLDEISNRLKTVTETLNMKVESMYLYNRDAAIHFIESDERMFHTHRCNKNLVVLSKEEYFERTLPNWGISILNCLDE